MEGTTAREQLVIMLQPDRDQLEDTCAPAELEKPAILLESLYAGLPASALEGQLRNPSYGSPLHTLPVSHAVHDLHAARERRWQSL